MKKMNTSAEALVSPAKEATPAALPNFISANLRLLRKEHGWSQSALADRVGLNRGNIASYESGTAEPSICKLLRFSNLFDITPRDFTRRDLSDPAELALARSAHYDEQDRRQGRYDAYRQRAEQLEQLVSASHHLHEHKVQTLDNPCREAMTISVQYQQLYELTRELLDQQQRLLSELGCDCKKA